MLMNKQRALNVCSYKSLQLCTVDEMKPPKVFLVDSCDIRVWTVIGYSLVLTAISRFLWYHHPALASFWAVLMYNAAAGVQVDSRSLVFINDLWATLQMVRTSAVALVQLVSFMAANNFAVGLRKHKMLAGVQTIYRNSICIASRCSQLK